MKLYLIDGSGFLYRAFYALPPMTDQQGRQVHVVYGFMRMILKILLDQPDYFVITRDAPTKTIRHELFPDYKANRKATPDEFKQQIPLVKRLIQDLQLPFVETPGYEADDLIYALAQKSITHEGITTCIYSSDKDLAQLLRQNIHIVDPMKNNMMKVKDFQHKYGFDPILIVDYLALIGDSSDNIKGVAGIGPKSAQKLIQAYGTIDDIYAHIDDVTGATKDKLLAGKESAYYSKKLIQLQDVPGMSDIALDKYIYHFDYQLFHQLLVQQYQFSSMDKILKELKKQQDTPAQQSLFG